MPTVVQPGHIQLQPRYGFFGAGGLGSAILSPFAQAAGQALSHELFGEQDPRLAAAEEALRQQKLGDAKMIRSRFQKGMLPEESARAQIQELGYDLEDPTIFPDASHDNTAETEKQGMTAAGYDWNTHTYPQQQTPASSTPTPSPAPAPVVASAPTAAPAVAPPKTLPDQAAQVGRDLMEATAPPVPVAAPPAQVVAPAATDDQDVIAPHGQFDPAQAAADPQYGQKFLPREEKPVPPDLYSKFSPEEQKRAQAALGRLNAYSAMMKNFHAQQAQTPEQMAQVYAMMRTTERDVEDMADLVNGKMGLDTGRIRALGGAAKLARAMAAYDLVTDRGKFYVLPKEVQDSLLAEVKASMPALQQLTGFDLKMVRDLAGSQSIGTLSQFITNNNFARAQQYGHEVDNKKAELSYSKDMREINYKMLNMAKDSDIALQQLRQKSVNDAARLSLDYSRFSTETVEKAQRLGIDKDKNAIDFAAGMQALQKDETDKYIRMLGPIMQTLDSQERALLNSAIRRGTAAQGSADLRAKLQEYNAMVAGADKHIGPAGSTEDNLRKRELERAKILLDELSSSNDISKDAAGVGILPADPASPDATRQQILQYHASLRALSEKIINQVMQSSQGSVPLVLYNIAQGANRNGNLSFNDKAVINIKGQGQKALDIMVTQARAYKAKPSYDQWLSLPVYDGASKTNGELFPGPNGQAMYNAMSRFFDARGGA